jgi:hypothetical protein
LASASSTVRQRFNNYRERDHDEHRAAMKINESASLVRQIAQTPSLLLVQRRLVLLIGDCKGYLRYLLANLIDEGVDLVPHRQMIGAPRRHAAQMRDNDPGNAVDGFIKISPEQHFALLLHQPQLQHLGLCPDVISVRRRLRAGCLADVGGLFGGGSDCWRAVRTRAVALEEPVPLEFAVLGKFAQPYPLRPVSIAVFAESAALGPTNDIALHYKYQSEMVPSYVRTRRLTTKAI